MPNCDFNKIANQNCSEKFKRRIVLFYNFSAMAASEAYLVSYQLYMM